MPRLLLVEDDEGIVRFLSRALTYEGYQVDVATDGETGLALAKAHKPDLVVLDWMLPGIDGLEVTRRLRKMGDMLILMLTAKTSVADRVQGLDVGADDYMVKPFNMDELLARIRALLRRSRQETPKVYRFADLELDTGTHEARRGDRRIPLTAKEYELLEFFMRHPHQVLTREQIYDQVWKYDFGAGSNLLEVYIRYLRRKLEAGGEPRLIHTLRGVGYVLRSDDES